MRRVTGVGGVFFKAEDPERLYQWYEKHLGIRREPDGDPGGFTAWAVFKKESECFNPSRAPFMVNYPG